MFFRIDFSVFSLLSFTEQSPLHYSSKVYKEQILHLWEDDFTFSGKKQVIICEITQKFYNCNRSVLVNSCMIDYVSKKTVQLGEWRSHQILFAIFCISSPLSHLHMVPAAWKHFPNTQHGVCFTETAEKQKWVNKSVWTEDMLVYLFACVYVCECTTAASWLLLLSLHGDGGRSCQFKHWAAGNRQSLLVLCVRVEGKKRTVRGEGRELWISPAAPLKGMSDISWLMVSLLMCCVLWTLKITVSDLLVGVQTFSTTVCLIWYLYSWGYTRKSLG